MYTTAPQADYSVRRYLSNRSEAKRAWRHTKEAAKVSRKGSLKAL